MTLPPKNLFPDLEFSLDELKQAVSHENNFEISTLFLKFLKYFNGAEVFFINEQQHDFINKFTEIFLKAFSSEHYRILPEFQEDFILSNVIISNLARVTPFINTDQALAAILKQENNAAKLLPLLSHRNNIKIDLENIFPRHPYHCSLWWANIIAYAWNSCNPLIFDNLKNWALVQNLAENLQIFTPENNQTIRPVFASFFQSTYIFPGADKPIRHAINKAVQEKNANLELSPLKPDFKKIAVFSSFLHKGHAVYRAIAPYLYSLKGHYHLTLLHFGEKLPGMELDEELFDEINIRGAEQREIRESAEYIISGNYGLLYYPDIGMTISSVIFSNLRLAPIQATGSGHPVSTFGSCIDYFIGGKDVEILSKAKENYSEKLLLIPGIGMVPVKPDYKPLHSISKASDTMNIICNWGSNKFYYPHLLVLKEIINAAGKNLILHFPGIHADKFNFLPFTHELKEMLGGEKCQIITYGNKKYNDYMVLIETCDFALDSYHFGGYNRIIDMLICGKPIVVLEGSQSYNRAAARILHDLGLSELVAANDEEYIKISLRLTQDLDYLISMQKKIMATDLEDLVFHTGKERYFKKAIDYLIANYRKTAGESPIIIED